MFAGGIANVGGVSNEKYEFEIDFSSDDERFQPLDMDIARLALSLPNKVEEKDAVWNGNPIVAYCRRNGVSSYLGILSKDGMSHKKDQ